MAQEDRQFVDALARGLAILEALSRAQKPLSNGELARATSLAPSTVSRLTHTLSILGYVRLSQTSRTYELTPKNLTLGYPVLAGMSLLERARPRLKQLSEKTGETAALAIRDGIHVTFVEVIQGSNMVAVRLATGGRLPIAVSAAGIAILSALPDRERRTVAARVRADITRRGGNPDIFNRHLASACQQGIAIIRDAWRPGIGGIAVPVLGDGDVAALTVPVATGSITEAAMRGSLAAVLRETAEVLGPARAIEA
jgi:DNA-binding IclR family transcriptional regulator